VKVKSNGKRQRQFTTTEKKEHHEPFVGVRPWFRIRVSAYRVLFRAVYPLILALSLFITFWWSNLVWPASSNQRLVSYFRVWLLMKECGVGAVVFAVFAGRKPCGWIVSKFSLDPVDSYSMRKLRMGLSSEFFWWQMDLFRVSVGERGELARIR
jgi:hypothetical protein